MSYEKYEDTIREGKKITQAKESPYCDLVYYQSSVTPGLRLAMRVLKPAKPSYILASTHGWHMSIPVFKHMDEAESEFLLLEIDMRGRSYSTGAPDCNGLELIDVIDAINFAKQKYAEYIIDQDVMYFESGSGGGGNALAIAGKFPDYFAAVNALYPIADYAKWYQTDSVGEFRDEMDVWIGKDPTTLSQAYDSRSGVTLCLTL